MGTSSNFGNMFSVTVAASFLPFLSMLPSQILLNNLLYDASQMAVPTDHVDEEQLARPSHWDIAFIRRFMVRIGPISSLFDFATFGVMLWVFNAGPALFRSGWFVESLATQTLVVFVIRTRRVPFFRSHPSMPLLVSMISVVTIGALIPESPMGQALGFAPLPLTFFLVLVVFVIAYLGAVELGKVVFFKAFSATVAKPLRRTHEHRVHRLAARWSHHSPLPDGAVTSPSPRRRPPRSSRRKVKRHMSGGVGEGGVEPPRPFGHRNLNPARLPIPPLARGGSDGSSGGRGVRSRDMPELPPPPTAVLPPAPMPGGTPPPAPAIVPNYAGFWIRVAAWLIDLLVLVPFYAAFVAAVIARLDGTEPDGGGDPTQAFALGGEFIAWALAIAAIGYCYQLLMIGRWNATVGKFATGLRVRRPDGSIAGWREAALRPLLEALLGIVNLRLVRLLDCLWMLWDRQKQTLHDKIAGTIVVRR